MSNTIDERVVKATFDNGQFQRGVQTTISALSALKSALSLNGATKGIEEVQSAASKFSLAGIGQGVDTIAQKFGALSVIGITALTNIANKAINAGLDLSRSLTLAPIKAGFDEYELKMGSIQTILANTARYGTKLPEVTKNLDELNTYADKTIYNFGDMTKNIGLFTNAGIKVGDATTMIKGFSNEAASSGTSAQGAASAAYQLSQALSAGKITLMDWRSLQNVGMGNKNMQNGIIEIADAMGTMKKAGVTANSVQKDFNGSLEKGWLKADVMSNYLKIMAGDMSVAEMKTLGLSDATIKTFQVQQKNSEEAATKVRTFTQLLGTMRESVGSGWSETFDTLIGDFNEASDMWTSVNNTLGGMIGAASKARNDLVKGWADMGGRQAAIDAIANSFKALMAFIKPIKDAFRDIFPAMTAQRLYDITVAIRDFTEKLKMGSETAAKVRRIFQGVFALLDIGRIIITSLLGVFGGLIGDLFKGSGGFLDFAVKIADWVTNLRYALKYGDGFSAFLLGLNNVLKPVIKLIRGLVSAFLGLFSGGTEGAVDRLSGRMDTFAQVGDNIAKAWGAVKDKLTGALGFLRPWAEAIGEAFRQLGQAISDSISTGDFSGILDALNTGLFAGLVVILRKFFKNGLDLNFDVGGGMFSSITDSFGALTDTLGAMQQNLKAEALMKIAAAVGILTISVVALSMIDSEKLTKSLAAIAIMFVQLAAGMALLDKAVQGPGFIKMPFLAASLILIAAAVDILAIAVIALSKLTWEEIAKGLTSVLVLLGGIAAVTNLMKSNKNMISTGLGMIAIAVAIKILASAVKDFSGMNWEEIAKGLTGVGAMLGAMALFTRLADLSKVGLSSGAGLILLSLSLKIMASAVGDFADMDWETLFRGFTGMAVALGLVTAAMNLMPKNMLVSAAGLLVVSASLVILAQVLKTMGGMSWEEIAKGLVTLAGSLIIIAGAMYLMAGALPGAAALIVVAASLAILAPVLLALGGMSWEAIGKGLLMLVGVFAVLGVAGLLLGPVVPILIGLGVAIALLGVGTLAAGLGLLAMSAGLTALSIAGTAGAVALTAMASAIIGLIPMALKAVGEGLVLLANVIAKSGPSFVAAMSTLIISLATAIDRTAPRVMSTLMRLIDLLLTTIRNNLPNFLRKGVDIIVSFIQGIANSIPRVATAAVNVITALIRSIGEQGLKIINAASETILKFANGLASSIRANGPKFGAAGANILSAMVEGLVGGVGAFAGTLWSAAQRIAGSFVDGIKSFLGINSPSKVMFGLGEWTGEGFVNGVSSYEKAVAVSAADVGHAAIDSMRKTITGLSDLVASDLNAAPTITPVLDLSNVKAGVKEINGLTSLGTISVGATYSSARSAQAARAANLDTSTTDVVDSGQPLVENTYNQYNTSPRALSEAEIYRQTHSLISITKGAVNA